MSEKAPQLSDLQKLFERVPAPKTRFEDSENPDIMSEKGFETFSLNDFSQDNGKVSAVSLNAGPKPKDGVSKRRPKGRIGGREKAKIAAILGLSVIIAALVLSLVVPGLREAVWGWVFTTKDLWIVPVALIGTPIVAILATIGLYAWDKKFNDPNQIKKANKAARKRKD